MTFFLSRAFVGGFFGLYVIVLLAVMLYDSWKFDQQICEHERKLDAAEEAAYERDREAEAVGREDESDH